MSQYIIVIKITARFQISLLKVLGVSQTRVCKVTYATSMTRKKNFNEFCKNIVILYIFIKTDSEVKLQINENYSRLHETIYQ